MTPREAKDTEPNTGLIVSENSLKLVAQQEFALAIKRAKRNGVDVAGIFLEVEEKVTLAWVRAFGLVLGIIWVFMCPLLIPLYRVWCFHMGMPYNLPEWYYYWPCIVGIISIIAFGFDLVDPRNLNRLLGRSKQQEVNEEMTRSGNFQIPKKLIDKLTGSSDDTGSNGDV